MNSGVRRVMSPCERIEGCRVEHGARGYQVFDDVGGALLGTIDRLGLHQLRWHRLRPDALGTARTWREAVRAIKGAV